MEIQSFYIIIVIVVIAIIMAITTNFFLSKKKKSNIVMAEIDKIQTLFIKNHKYLEPYLSIQYHYFVKKKKYNGSCKIPFSFLLDNNHFIQLYLNQELDLPVLQINQEVIVGNEAIEHKLLSVMPYIPIRYLTSDPSRNFILPLNRKYGLFHKKIKKIS